MTLFQHYQVSLILSIVITIIVGLWVLIQKRHSKVAQFFCLYSLPVALWSWCQLQGGLSTTPSISLVWIRAMFYAVIIFPVLLTHFFSAFLRVDQRKMCLIGWILVVSFLPFISSNQFLRESGPLGFLPAMPRAGPLFLPFNLVWFGWIFYDWWLLSRGSQDGKGPGRKQVNWLFAAFVFGYATGCVNFLYLYGICLPPIQPFGDYGVPIGFLAIAYGVFIYGLFDIQVVIRRSLVYSFLVTLLSVGYFGAIYLIEGLFQTQLGYRSSTISVAAFALMALLFQPLKIGIQQLIDWLIFRKPHEEMVKQVERLEQEVLQTEKLKAISTLAAGMAHEIKNPLTALKTFTEFIPEKQNDPIFLKKLYEVFTMETQRIQEVVQELLEFAKPKTPRFKSVNIGPIINSTVDFLSGDLLKRSIQWTISCRHNGATIQADQDQLRQILINLIQNAADAMPTGGTLTLATQVNDGYLELAITDTGEGIPKELLPKIFDPFVTTKPTGTGLGLAMVQTLVRAHHGTISVVSTPARGTTFTLRFPL